MSDTRKRRFAEMLLLVGIALCVLWKGGKAVDATWIVLLLACSLHLVWRKKSDTAVPPVLWWIGFAFVALTICSYLTSQTQNYGLDEVLQTVSLALIGAWVIRHAYGEGRDSLLHHTVRAIALAGFAAAAIGIAVYILQPVTRFVGSFFDYRFHTDYWPNAWAEFALLAWPLLAFSVCGARTADYKRQRSRDAIAGLVCGLFLGCLLLSYSRGAVLAFGLQIGLGVVLLCVRGFGKVSWPRVVSIAVVSGVTAVAAFAGINLLRSNLFPVESVYSKVTFQADEGKSSVSERSQFWSVAVWMTQEKPLLGWGPYSFRFVQPVKQTTVWGTSDHPHNVVLKFAAERGVVAAGLFVVLVAMILLTAVARTVRAGLSEIKTRKVADHNTVFKRSCRMAAVVSISGVLAHNMIDFNLQFMGVALPMTVLLALLADGAPVKKAAADLRSQAELLIAVLLLAVGIVEGAWLVSSSLGRHAERDGKPLEAMQWYRWSKHEFFSRDMLLSLTQLEGNADGNAAARETLARYRSLNPVDYRAMKLEADLEAWSGNYAQAIAMYDKANERAQFNDITVTSEIVSVFMDDKRITGDLDQRLPAIQKQMNEFAYAIEQNAHFIALSSNVESLADLANKLASLYPDEKEMYVGLADHITAKAAEEREKLNARQPGLLWKATK